MSKPTREDAELLLRYLALRDKEDRDAHRWFFEEFTEKSWRAFKKKYPERSEGRRNFNRFVGFWEGLSTLVVNDLLSEHLVFDMFLIPWKKAELIVKGIRREMKEPRIYENFEVLAKRAAEWQKTHPPKV